VYVLGTATVFGTVGQQTLVDSTSPFSDSAAAIFGASWAGQAMAVVAIISGLGCLNGWTLICAEMPMAAAHDRLFPTQFAKLSKKEIPVFGIVVATVLASVLTAFGYWSFETVFTNVVLLGVFTAVIPYLFSAAAHLYWLIVEGRALDWPHLVRDLVVTAFALVFTFWALAGSGYQAVYYGVFVFFLGIPVYVWMKSQRKEYGETPVLPIQYAADSPYFLSSNGSNGAAASNTPEAPSEAQEQS
jgi:basic amino acid/polyamine antiporter, APA family